MGGLDGLFEDVFILAGKNESEDPNTSYCLGRDLVDLRIYHIARSPEYKLSLRIKRIPAIWRTFNTCL
jgi:hypothetical protein